MAGAAAAMARRARCAAVLILSLIAAAAANQQSYTLAAEEDRVQGLPGAPGPLEFGLFAGNVTVDAAAGRALFYVFAERATDPASAPIVLWLNGGPACSSLGGGFMSELGPFFPAHGGTALKANPYAWNNGLANVLFLESPAMVGFSFSKRPADAVVGDQRTAADSYRFLLAWLDRFPQYAGSPLVIAGESYGGHYVPNLALEIVRHNDALSARTARGSARAASSRNRKNAAAGAKTGRGGGGADAQRRVALAGIFVGNAWTDPEIDNKGALDFWYSHALIGADEHKGIHKHCNFSDIGPLAAGRHALSLSLARGRKRQSGSKQSGTGDDPSGGDDEAKCEEYVDKAFGSISGINIYDIYADVCDPPEDAAAFNGAAGAAARASARRWRGALLGRTSSATAAAPSAQAASLPAASPGMSVAKPHPGRVPRYDPCIDSKVEVYLNLPEVQAALHANQTGELPGPWQDCTEAISYSRSDLLTSMLPVWRELLDRGGLTLWVFSGDVDGIVPVLGSRRWVEGLRLPVLTPWRPWSSATGQVGGWRVDYRGLTFATVRNAGHMVPYVQAERAYRLLKDFLAAAADAPTPPKTAAS